MHNPADPGGWGVPSKYAGAFANTFLRKRARAAAKLRKPYILEGVGMVRERHRPHAQPLASAAGGWLRPAACTCVL